MTEPTFPMHMLTTMFVAFFFTTLLLTQEAVREKEWKAYYFVLIAVTGTVTLGLLTGIATKTLGYNFF